MFESYFGIIVILVAGVLTLSQLFIPTVAHPAERISKQAAKNRSVSHSIAPRQVIASSLPPANRNIERSSVLRANLTQKALGNKAVVDRLIAFERGRNPNAGLTELMQNAIDRWERDSRV